MTTITHKTCGGVVDPKQAIPRCNKCKASLIQIMRDNRSVSVGDDKAAQRKAFLDKLLGKSSTRPTQELVVGKSETALTKVDSKPGQQTEPEARAAPKANEGRKARKRRRKADLEQLKITKSKRLACGCLNTIAASDNRHTIHVKDKAVAPKINQVKADEAFAKLEQARRLHDKACRDRNSKGLNSVRSMYKAAAKMAWQAGDVHGAIIADSYDVWIDDDIERLLTWDQEALTRYYGKEYNPETGATD